jgi:hypothetical protein
MAHHKVFSMAGEMPELPESGKTRRHSGMRLRSAIADLRRGPGIDNPCVFVQR